MASSSLSAAVLIIGNEILSGRTQDQNIQYIASSCAKKGIVLSEVRVVPDIEARIIDAVNALRATYDYVFTTGGIGPTHDDITSDSVAKAFGVELVQHPEALARLSEFYEGKPMNEGRLKMTFMPEGAGLIDNPISTAPGFYMDNVYVLAGIPNIMRAMFDHVITMLGDGEPILSKEIEVMKPESAIANFLTDLDKRYDDVEIGSYPFVKGTSFGVSVVLRGTHSGSIDAVYKELGQYFATLN